MYAKLSNNLVIQLQRDSEPEFEDVPDYVRCGMVKQSDGSFLTPGKNEKHDPGTGAIIQDDDKVSTELNRALDDKLAEIEKMADEQIAGETFHAVTLGGQSCQYDCRDIDQRNLDRAIRKAARTGAPVPYLAKKQGGQFAKWDHTAAELDAVDAAMDVHIETNRDIARSYTQAAIAEHAKQDLSELQAIDPSAWVLQ